MTVTFEVTYGYEGGCFGGKKLFTILKAALDEYDERNQDKDLAECRITQRIKIVGMGAVPPIILMDRNGAHFPQVKKPGPATT